MATISAILELVNLAQGESAHGSETNWGDVTDANFTKVEAALGEVTSKVLGAIDVNLTDSEHNTLFIKLTGVLLADVAVETQDRKGFWLVSNACTGDFAVTFKTATGTGVVIPQGGTALVASDGTNIIAIGLFRANGAGARIKHATKAAGSYTAAVTDDGAFHEVTATATISLKPAALLGDQWALLVKANGAVATIDPNGAELINGALTLALADGQSALIVCTGSAFRAIVLGAGTVTLSGAQTLADKSLVDASNKFVGSGDATKAMRFEVDGITTATERVVTARDADGTMAFTTDFSLDLVAAAPAASQNNYAPGLSATNGRLSILNLSPTVSMVLTGIDTTGWTAGKRLIVRNATYHLDGSARLIILPRNSILSTQFNRFLYAGNKRIPLTLMPEESAEFLFDGFGLKLLGTSRAPTRGAYFDQSFGGDTNWDPWLGGTGASAAYASQGDDGNGDPYTFMKLATGTTATGFASMVTNDGTSRTTEGCLMFLGRCRVVQLSTAAQEFDCHFGFTKISAVTDGIEWTYDRNISTNWLFRAIANSAVTSVDTGVAVAASGAGSVPCLGVFVNGDASRAEAFYSADDGVTWNVVATAITVNIPGATREFGHGGSIVKSAGTTDTEFRVLFAGQTGWL